VHMTVPWLSQYSGVSWLCGDMSSSKRERSHIIWQVQWEQAMYSASHNNSAITTCCLELHVSGPLAHLMMKPETDLRFLDMAQSESANDMKIGYVLGELL